VLTFNGIEIEDARGLVTPDPYGGDISRRAGSALASGLRGVRKEVLGQDVHDTGMPDYFPRVTTDAMLHTPAGNFVRVLSGHYNGPRTETAYQKFQVAPVAELADDWAGPTIWGADFNVRSGGANGRYERTLLDAAGLDDSFIDVGVRPGSTERGTDIDRIYHSSQFDVESVDVARFAPGEPEASDHFPVTAELRLRPSGEGAG
jgi:endonuclease/exonuclease/phosphatase family metal-dependent hydrolase